MRITVLLFLWFTPITNSFAQGLDRLSREMVFGDDTSYALKSYQYFMSLLGDRKLETENIQKFNGVAISPEAAAACLLEHTRTQTFVRGLYQAAKSIKKQNVNILYVGCGPLAPFMTLTAPLLPDARYTLVEISENAADNARILINRLGLQAQLDTLILADAIELKLPDAEQFDIIITETMDAGLNNEMMIPILDNILPQLKPGVILIPEEVTFELQYLKKTGQGAQPENQLLFAATDLLNCYREAGEFPYSEIDLPELQSTRVFVVTTVRVYRDIFLHSGESAITQPLRFRPVPGKTLRFSYRMTPPTLILRNGMWRR